LDTASSVAVTLDQYSVTRLLCKIVRTPHQVTTSSTCSSGAPKYERSSSRGPVAARSAAWRAITAACINENPYWAVPGVATKSFVRSSAASV
jgi:hypothetical protein